MSRDNDLKTLCHALVGQKFESVHDAEQAFEQFESMTTPDVVLGWLTKIEALTAVNEKTSANPLRQLRLPQGFAAQKAGGATVFQRQQSEQGSAVKLEVTKSNG